MFHSIYMILPPSVASHIETKIVFTIIDCVYALQGVYILVIMVMRLHIKKNLGGMRWFCWSTPAKWTEVDDAADAEPPSNDTRRNSVGMSIYYT